MTDCFKQVKMEKKAERTHFVCRFPHTYFHCLFLQVVYFHIHISQTLTLVSNQVLVSVLSEFILSIHPSDWRNLNLNRPDCNTAAAWIFTCVLSTTHEVCLWDIHGLCSGFWGILFFCFCACKHHPISETRISPHPGIEKPEHTSWSTLKETGTLLHIYIWSRFLSAADYLHRRGFSQVMWQKHRKHLIFGAMKKLNFVCG